jgi:hypothetical protein
MEDIHDDEGIYVCITHHTITPCEEGDHHLISNWATDVKKILKIIEKNS